MIFASKQSLMNKAIEYENQNTKTLNMKKIILLFAASFALYSCGSGSVDLAIDNPTDQSIIVKVDTLTVEVPAKEVVWVEMGKGEHEITLEDDTKTKFDFTEAAYLLNPTKNEYLKTEEFYGSTIHQNSFAHQLPKKSIEYYGMPLDGNFDVVRNLINPISWDYGPREVLPEMLEMEGEYEVVIKLHDFNEFSEIINQEFESDSLNSSQTVVEAGTN